MLIRWLSVRLVAVSLVLTAPVALGQNYTWEIYAGSQGGAGAADGSGTAARLDRPRGLALDGSGNIYVVENGHGAVRVITPAGVVTTLVRNDGGSQGDGRRGEVRFSNPGHVMFDGSGNLLVTDGGTNTIRRVTPTGLVTLFAGSPFSEGTANGPLTSAQFRRPFGIARNAATGDIYVSDETAHTIRKISAATGLVTTFAGVPDSSGSNDSPDARFNRPQGLAIDAGGNVYVADRNNHKIRKITPGGVVSTFAGSGSPGSANGSMTAASFNQPNGLAFYGSNLFVADTGNQKIRVISSTGNVSNYAGSGEIGYFDSSISVSRFRQPAAIVFDGSGNLFVSDEHNHAVRKVTGSGVTTLGGQGIDVGSTDSFGVLARFNQPHGIVADSSGNLYVADHLNSTIRKVTPGALVPQVTTFAGSAGMNGYTDAAGTSARFYWPRGLATDGTHIYVADYAAHTVRKIVISTGAVTTVAGLGGQIGSTDAAESNARFQFPSDVAVDAAGNIYVADLGNHAIRKIDTGGNVTTFAGSAGMTGTTNATGTNARFNGPEAVAVDNSGNVYVADSVNQVIRRITSGGIVTTFAGAMGEVGYADGVGGNARFFYPHAIDYGGDGYLYVSDTTSVVRRINVVTAEVTSIGGQSFNDGHYDGTGLLSRFGHPSGFAVHDGDIYVADRDVSALRIGRLALNAAAAIDSATGAPSVTRQLSTSPNPGTFWQWRLVRRPTGSMAALSSTSTANPTFTPDIPDVYTFRLLTTNDTSRSITEVSLTVPCNAITIGPPILPHPVNGASYAQALTATGGTGSGYLFEVASGSLPPGLTLSSSGTISGTPTTNGSYTFTVRVSDSAACFGSREHTLVVAPIAAPAGLTATGSPSPLRVTLSWTAVSGAAGYKVYRLTRFAGWTEIGTAGSAAYNDEVGITANDTYAYKVRAYTAAMEETGDSLLDLAHTMTVDPVTPGGIVYAWNLYQLRSIVGFYRQMISADTITTDPTLNGVVIKAVHIEEVRGYLNDLLSRVGRPVEVFTDSSLTGLPVKAVHFSELQEAMR